jgi:hypothetical protein
VLKFKQEKGGYTFLPVKKNSAYLSSLAIEGTITNGP